MKLDVTQILLIALLAYFFLMWFSLVVWVWNDVRERTNDPYFRYISLILAALGHIFGVAVYLVIRPNQTFNERFFTDLEEKIILAQAREFGVLDEKGLAKATRVAKKRKSRLSTN